MAIALLRRRKRRTLCLSAVRRTALKTAHAHSHARTAYVAYHQSESEASWQCYEMPHQQRALQALARVCKERCTCVCARAYDWCGQELGAKHGHMSHAPVAQLAGLCALPSGLRCEPAAPNCFSIKEPHAGPPFRRRTVAPRALGLPARAFPRLRGTPVHGLPNKSNRPLQAGNNMQVGGNRTAVHI